jgi:CheY-like chemotaxis protein
MIAPMEHMSPESRRHEVIVVDDDHDVCEALASLITGDGHRATTFTKAQDALHYVREVPPPALILVDACMPGLDGWEFLAELRRLPAANAAPAFLMSANTRLDEERALDLDARGVLRKPFDFSRLSSVIQTHCAARQP